MGYYAIKPRPELRDCPGLDGFSEDFIDKFLKVTREAWDEFYKGGSEPKRRSK